MTPNLLTPDLAAFIEATNEYFSRHRQSKRTARILASYSDIAFAPSRARASFLNDDSARFRA
jgi:hypothetical protein